MTTKKAPKDRGLDRPVASEKAEVCAKKFLNMGQEIEVGEETWVVKDIPLDAWLTNLASVLPILIQLAESGSKDSSELVVSLAAQPVLRNAVYELLAQSVRDKSVEDIKQLSITDTLRLLNAVKEVVDFKEIKELFTRLVPGVNLPRFSTGNKGSQAPAKS